MLTLSEDIRDNRSTLWRHGMNDMGAAEALFYCAFAIYSLGVIIDSSALSQVLPEFIDAFDTLVQVSVISLLLIKFFIQRAAPKSWAFACLLVFVGLLSWHRSQEGWFFWVPLFIVCAEGVKIEALAKVSLAIISTIFLFIVMLCLFGLLPDIQIVQDGWIRHSLGFQHPNTLALLPLMACVSYSVLHFWESPFKVIFLLAACELFNMLTAQSRTVLLLLVIQIVLIAVFHFLKNPNKRKIATICFALIAGAVIGLSFYLMVAFDATNAVHSGINSALSGRIYLANGYYEMLPLSLFGNSYSGCPSLMWWEPEDTRSIVIDNAWCHLILRFGIVPTLLTLTGIFMLYKYKISAGHWDVVLYGITLMVCYGFTETVGIRIEYDYFLIAIGSQLLYRSGHNGTFKVLNPRKNNNDCNLSSMISAG